MRFPTRLTPHFAALAVPIAGCSGAAVSPAARDDAGADSALPRLDAGAPGESDAPGDVTVTPDSGVADGLAPSADGPAEGEAGATQPVPTQAYAQCIASPTLAAAAAADAGQRWWFPMGPLSCATFFPFRILSAPSDPATLFAATSQNGFFSSKDGGSKWRHVNAQGPIAVDGTYAYPNNSPLVFDPNDASLLYAIARTDGGSGPVVVARSTDLGQTWAEASRPAVAGNAIAFDARHPGTLYVVVQGQGLQVAKSVDGGATFTTLAGTLSVPDAAYTSVTQLAVASTGRLYAYLDGGSPSALLASDDDGASWKVLLEKPSGLGGFALAPSDPTVIYAVIGQVCRSGDTGATWTCTDTPAVVHPQQGVIFDAFAGVDPLDPSRVYLVRSDGQASGHLYDSSDGASTWQEIATPNGYPLSDWTWAGSRLVVAQVGPGWSSPSMTAVGAIVATTDRGATWSDLSAGLTMPSVTSVLYATTTTVYATMQLNPQGSGEMLVRSMDEGATWTAAVPKTEMPQLAVLDPGDPRTFIGTDSTLRFTSDSPDAGVTLSVNANAGIVLGPPLHDAGAPAPWPLSGLSVDPSDSMTRFACAGPDLYATRDGAATWTKTSLATGCTATAVDPIASATVVAATTSPVLVRKSLDRGATWLAAPAAIPSALSIQSLIFDPSDDTVLFAFDISGSGRWLVSRDGGATFSDPGWALDGSAQLPFGQLAFDGTAPGTMYATSAAGVWKSTDHGRTWTSIDTGLAGVRPCGLAVSPVDGGHLLLAGCNAGLFGSVSGGQ